MQSILRPGYPGVSLLASLLLAGSFAAVAHAAPGAPGGGTVMVVQAAAAMASAADSQAAIEQAEKTLAEAKAICRLWRDTEKIMASAKAAREAGDHAKAIRNAAVAEEQAEDCVNQDRLEKSKFLLEDAAAHTAEMSGPQRIRYEQAKKAVADKQGVRAYELLTGLLAELS